MGMSAAHCQGISECLESGHPESLLVLFVGAFIVFLLYLPSSLSLCL